MTKISGRDASLLALLAEGPISKSRAATKIRGQLGVGARDIAEAMRSSNTQASTGAAATARGYRDWVSSNKISPHKNRARRQGKT